MSDDRGDGRERAADAQPADTQEQSERSKEPVARTSSSGLPPPGGGAPPPPPPPPGNGTRARYSRGSQQIQTTVDIATEFLKSTYEVGKEANGNDDITVSRIIPNTLGGTLCLIEYQWTFDEQYYDCCIIVRADECILYDSVPDVMRMIAESKVHWLLRISEPRVVIGFLTLFILCAGFALWWFSSTDLAQRNVPEPYRAGLTAVIGYWLGQAFPVARQGARSTTG
jgi:hypothetical protein